MRVSLEFYVSEVLSADDLDELTDLVLKAVEKNLGEVDYTIQDAYINLEIDDV